MLLLGWKVIKIHYKWMWLCGVYACDYGVVCAFSSLFQISLPCVNESECNVFPFNMDLNPRVLIWRVFMY